MESWLARPSTEDDRAGEVNLFSPMLKKLADLREQLLRRIIFEQGSEGLAIACNAIKIEKSYFSTNFALSRRANTASVKYFSMEIQEILKFYENLAVEAAQKVLSRWQRDSNYLAAIRELEIFKNANNASQAQKILVQDVGFLHERADRFHGKALQFEVFQELDLNHRFRLQVAINHGRYKTDEIAGLAGIGQYIAQQLPADERRII